MARTTPAQNPRGEHNSTRSGGLPSSTGTAPADMRDLVWASVEPDMGLWLAAVKRARRREVASTHRADCFISPPATHHSARTIARYAGSRHDRLLGRAHVLRRPDAPPCSDRLPDKSRGRWMRTAYL